MAPEEPRPTWRTIGQAKAIIEQRLSEVLLNLRTYKPVALPEFLIEISIESVRLSKFSNDNIEILEKTLCNVDFGLRQVAASLDAAVRARRGRLSGLSVSLCKSIFYGAFVWARGALNRPKWRFPAG